MSEINNAASESNESDINDVEQAPAVVGKKVVTKEERIAKIDAQIAVLTTKRQSIIDGTEVRATAPKVVVLPEVGASITFRHGRKTATTEPAILSGQVFAIKLATDADGKRTPAIIKVLVGEGADAEFFTVYPAQIVEAVTEEVTEESAE